MTGTSEPEDISTRLQSIATLAREAPNMVMVTLAHHIDIDFLKEAFDRTRKDGAVGVDGQTAEAYGANLEENLQSLLERFKSGLYRAPPVRRAHIPKGDGKTRPLGIPTFEDKVLQRAVTMVLEAVYEQDFKSCSHGFRPGRSAHGALKVLWNGLMKIDGGWILDADVEKFFDRLDHQHLRSFLDQRVRDGVIRRAIGKWLNAGVMEEGQHHRTSLGTPQGGVISPLLANIYLHEVLDKWFATEVVPRLKGKAGLVRYADDFVIVFEREDDARRVMEVLPKRFARFGLTLHPDKTRLLDFRSPQIGRPRIGGDGPSQRDRSFDFLGFTHYWGRSRRGNWVVRQKTAKSRFKRAVKAIAKWCRRYRHLPVGAQRASLELKLMGHYNYYGLTGNFRALAHYRQQVVRIWHKWLARRSQRGMPWARFRSLLTRYPLPQARVVHSVFA
jgi:group II intron reverse transcriptase/maturase